MTAIWPAGPPKLKMAARSQTRSALAEKDAVRCASMPNFRFAARWATAALASSYWSANCGSIAIFFVRLEDTASVVLETGSGPEAPQLNRRIGLSAASWRAACSSCLPSSLSWGDATSMCLSYVGFVEASVSMLRCSLVIRAVTFVAIFFFRALFSAD
jgi:hypothetical protein